MTKMSVALIENLRKKNTGLILLGFFLNLYVFTSNGSPWREADDQFNYARHFLQTGSLSQETYPHIGHMKGVNGKVYDCHGLANIMLFTVPLALEPVLKPILKDRTLLFLRLLSILSGAFFAALALWAFYLILIQLGYLTNVAIKGTLLLGLTSTLWPYSAMNYEVNLFLCFSLFAYYFFIKCRKHLNVINILAMTSFSGLSLLTRDFAIIFCGYLGFFFLYQFIRVKKYKAVMLAIIGFLPWIAIWGYYNYIRTGNFVLSPILFQTFSGVEHYQVLAPKHSIWRGLSVFLMSPGGSLFVFSPLLLVSLFGIKQSFEKDKLGTLFISLYSLTILVAAAKIGNFFGSPGFGPRYLVGIVPFIFLLAMPIVNSFPKIRKSQQKLMIGLAGFGFLVQLSAVFTFWKARIPFLHQPGTMEGMWTVSGSQWFDTISIFFGNLLNMIFGIQTSIELVEMSEASAHAARSLFTWWNRLMALGIPSFVVVAYVLVSLVGTGVVMRKLMRVDS